jgi:hypothetical protein
LVAARLASASRGAANFPPDGRSLTPICATRPLVTAPAAVRCGLARTRAFESVPDVAVTALQESGQIGVARPRRDAVPWVISV